VGLNGPHTHMISSLQRPDLHPSGYSKDNVSQQGISRTISNLWFLTCWEFPTGDAVCKWRMTSRTEEPLFQNLSHPNVDLLYKSQLFTDCFNN